MERHSDPVRNMTFNSLTKCFPYYTSEEHDIYGILKTEVTT